METRTEISSLGEFGLIKRINSGIKTTLPDTIRGIGDDAAVIDTGEEYGLLSSDLLLEGVHFDLTFFPLKHLGYKAISVNVSDIAAMNGIPRQVTVNLALSNRFSLEAIDELYEGMKVACADFNVDLVGGDTSSSRSGLLISVSVFGKVNKDKITYRNTAKPNDLLCVTGDLGGAYLGLQLLEREKQVFLANPEMQPELEGKDYVIQRQLRPEARMDVVYELAEAGVLPTSMIDVSDGLASDLLHICAQSGVGAVVFEERIPIDEQTYLAASELNIGPITAAMNGGEDYELLFTVPQASYDLIKNNPKISFIGYITANKEEIVLHTKGDSRVPITAQGWS
ncbi:thiamine-phosphate kinase [Dyadobacter fanqingshengii]|uniref:Thiamine-monophosphate kinase n=1 Tax=Dyadobacter fanqingshengii TaxID=2906443 RepID=A0A9X1PET8_9BACT|nr:thiamine-phosphate kinase [Dyadobacter fanqingshengii]MCF0042383.1 thiamine-phosphate kinase [Dyadobacter fanqingshengii]MCF2506573.1 thiamine-phosphate kinase [Dyadobacter fanqingshengii]USJ35091.1 thiamine-phosphate kinase [Dyadobacter fanqingshengii]